MLKNVKIDENRGYWFSNPHPRMQSVFSSYLRCTTHFVYKIYPKNYTRSSWFSVFVMVIRRWILPIPFRVTSLSLGQSYDCPSDSESTWRMWVNKSYHQLRTGNITTTKQSETKSSVFYGVYCTHFGNIGVMYKVGMKYSPMWFQWFVTEN